MNNLDQARVVAERLGLTLCVVGPDRIEVTTTGDEEPRMMTVEQFLRVYEGIEMNENGYSYLDSTVTPNDLLDYVADAVASEQKKIADYLSSSWVSSSLDDQEIAVVVKIKVPFLMNETTHSTILRAIRSAAK